MCLACLEGYGDRIVAEGTASLSAHGGWEAAWNIPDKIKLGSYEIRAQIGADIYDGTTFFRVEEYRVPIFSVVVEAKSEVGQTAHAHLSSAYFHGAPNVGGGPLEGDVDGIRGIWQRDQSYKKRSTAFPDRPAPEPTR